MSDRKATLLACGCLLLFLAADVAVTALLVVLLIRLFG